MEAAETEVQKENTDYLEKMRQQAKDMWIAYSPGSPGLEAKGFWSPANQAYAESVGGFVEVQPCLTMKTAQGSIQMGWLASQSDMLAEDWSEVV
jgi:hypothetical protein